MIEITIAASDVVPDTVRVSMQGWAAWPTPKIVLYLTHEELRDLADAIIAYELTLEESERRKPV